MMKKGLLIWNVVVTVIALVLIFGACTSDSRIGWAVTQITAQSVTIQQLQSDVNTLQSTSQQASVYLQAHADQITNLQNQINTLIQIVNAQ
jgi:TolA-binding protein